MKKEFIGILDSGVGGLSLLKILNEKVSGERFLYFGDNQNAPYGNKSIRELKSLTINNILYMCSFGLKAIVVACNTLSVNLLNFIKELSDVPVFGVFPPIERYLVSNKKICLIATNRTAERYKNINNLKSIGLDYLAESIEKNMFNLKNIDIDFHLPKFDFNYDVLILGCTHYNFIKDTIFKHKKPPRIDFGEKYTVDMIIKDLNLNKNTAITKIPFKS